MIHEPIESCAGRTPLMAPSRQFPPPGPAVAAKLEMLNPSGSMKGRSVSYILSWVNQYINELNWRAHFPEAPTELTSP